QAQPSPGRPRAPRARSRHVFQSSSCHSSAFLHRRAAPAHCGRTAIAGFYPPSRPKCARELSRPQYGNGHSRSFSLAIAHSGGRQGDSKKKKNNIGPQNSMTAMGEMGGVDMGMPSHDGSWLKKIETNTMKAAPRNEPSGVPSPPMMIMNST